MKEGTLLPTTEMKRIIWDYYKQLYANKLDNLDEMLIILERWKLLKLGTEIENLN